MRVFILVKAPNQRIMEEITERRNSYFLQALLEFLNRRFYKGLPM